MMDLKRNTEQSGGSHPQLTQLKIVKRDGRLVDFDDQKIYDALVKAQRKVKGELFPSIMNGF